jgi:hypothetical protein
MAQSTKDQPTAEDLAKRQAEKLAEHQLDPGAAAQAAALLPEPVYHLPDQAVGNPGVQGFVFRPHQEQNPGADLPGRAKDKDALAAQIRLEKEARDRRGQTLREAAQKRGETLPEPVGPARLRMHVDVSAHSVVDEAKLGAVAAAADALVAAIRDAGVDAKASVSGIPF